MPSNKIILVLMAVKDISFRIHIQEPHLHTYQVEMRFLSTKKGKISLRIPTWSTGSYMIRDYAGNLFDFDVFDESGSKIDWIQNDLSEWKLRTENAGIITVRYKVFGFENTVRTNFLNSSFGFINPPSTFLHPKSKLHKPVKVYIESGNLFSETYCSLTREENFFTASDYDELYDSPFLITNAKSHKFEASGCLHEIVIQGDFPEKKKKKFFENLETIVNYQSEIFEGNPNKYYLFILNAYEDVYGGLEHKSCSVNAFDISDIDSVSEYQKMLSLLCHEYFHLWNVKRIRPESLVSFDYFTPNLTRELWISEGITSFYDNYILYKTGIMSINDYLNEILSDINRLADSSGEEYMSLEEASFTAWTKYYKQNPNSHNVSISYYIKGFLLSLCMNIRILEQTEGRKNLMHLMRELYRKYHLKKNKGFTKQEFFKTAEEEFGFDLQAEFEQYISEKIRIPAEIYLDKLGIKLAKTMKKSVFPFEVKTESGKQIISKIFNQWNIPDLEIGDELIGINSRRVNRDIFEKLKLSLPDSSEAELILSRKGRIFYAKVQTKMIYTYQIPYPVLEEDFEEIFRTNRIAECFFKREVI